MFIPIPSWSDDHHVVNNPPINDDQSSDDHETSTNNLNHVKFPSYDYSYLIEKQKLENTFNTAFIGGNDQTEFKKYDKCISNFKLDSVSSHYCENSKPYISNNKYLNELYHIYINDEKKIELNNINHFYNNTWKNVNLENGCIHSIENHLRSVTVYGKNTNFFVLNTFDRFKEMDI
ncbi:predicted protein [Naegleria gruberi]|uniref:Predicted protein n=1 Tax=Naegleria gruberi TaxID=5762 RepID=D2VC60_NAEGR|nr:uncharacterized protein NAEGRDRAFT_66458 [Naegleria gruberi]EFC45602.1 predicted protein [Naegleria gruberi]|eukprot:XP_002678346.1 predicted protein [Naegleria gruberi strain NEG-M]